MEQYPLMVECLKELNYPQVRSMNDVEIADVFGKMNRQFLVVWILKQLDEGYAEMVEKATKEELANIVCCNGFCTSSEKNLFINGESDITKQMNILYKMFKYLKNVCDYKKNDESKNVSLTQIENHLQFNTNLFPMYGSTQILTPQARIKKIQEYQEEIERIRNILESKSQEEDKCEIDPSLKHQLQAAMKNLQINFPEFKRKVLDLMKNRESAEPEKMCFNENCEEILNSCASSIGKVLQFIKGMNVIMNFKENDFRRDPAEHDARSNAMMHELAELCNEIYILRKESLGI